MSASTHESPIDADEVRRRVEWLRRKRWTDLGITAAWAGALVGATYWRQGADLLSHGFAAFMVVLFAVGSVVLVVRDHRELSAARVSDEAMRAWLRTQLDMRLNGFRTMKTVRQVLKVFGVLIVLLGILIVVKEQLLGNGWAGIPMFATTILWAWLFAVWPTYEERRVLPRLERARAELGA